MIPLVVAHHREEEAAMIPLVVAHHREEEAAMIPLVVARHREEEAAMIPLVVVARQVPLNPLLLVLICLRLKAQPITIKGM
jgi:hypothetical protein